MDLEGVSAGLLVSVIASDDSLVLLFTDLSGRCGVVSHAIIGRAAKYVDWLPNMWAHHRENCRTILEVGEDE